MSHQLPAWPGTTITSSSCSSSVTAVSRRRGCRTGSGPCRVFFTSVEEQMQLCGQIVLLLCVYNLLFFIFFIQNGWWNVHIRHISVALTGRRLCVRAGHVSHSGRISLTELKDSPLEDFLVYLHICGDICFSCRTKQTATPTGVPMIL